jgi:hypothetical protein
MTILAFSVAAIAAVSTGAVLGAATYLCLAEKSSPAEWDWQQHR